MSETTRHRHAFERYWRLGATRSIERLRADLASAGATPTVRTLYEWSRRYHWQDRIAGQERAAREADDEARIAALKEMQARHVKEALLLQQKGTEWLLALDPEAVTAEAGIRALTEGIRLERLVQGEPTQRIDVEGQTGLEALTDAELDQLTTHLGRRMEGDAQPQPG